MKKEDVNRRIQEKDNQNENTVLVSNWNFSPTKISFLFVYCLGLFLTQIFVLMTQSIASFKCCTLTSWGHFRFNTKSYFWLSYQSQAWVSSRKVRRLSIVKLIHMKIKRIPLVKVTLIQKFILQLRRYNYSIFIFILIDEIDLDFLISNNSFILKHLFVFLFLGHDVASSDVINMDVIL